MTQPNAQPSMMLIQPADISTGNRIAEHIAPEMHEPLLPPLHRTGTMALLAKAAPVAVLFAEMQLG